MKRAYFIASVVVVLGASPAAALFEDVSLFDDNPAADAVPPENTIDQRTTVSSDAHITADAPANASQYTRNQIDDRITYNNPTDYSNAFLRQGAEAQINQSCRVNGTCNQSAVNDIRQHADIDVPGKFSNVFVEQDARSRIDQDCAARDCVQSADHRIDQSTNTSSHWSSNVFVTRDHDRFDRQHERSYGDW